jgi:DNA-binding PadR family transcriptional regulator
VRIVTEVPRRSGQPPEISPHDYQILEHLTEAFGHGPAARQRLKDALTPRPFSVRTLDRELKSLTARGFLTSRQAGRATYYAVTSIGLESLRSDSRHSRQTVDMATVATGGHTLRGGHRYGQHDLSDRSSDQTNLVDYLEGDD